MASKYWIKLYHELLHDPKIGRLPDRAFRRFIELLLIAGETEADGYLPAPRDMAWTLRSDEAELVEDLELLAQAGMLRQTDDGWLVVNFAKRQAFVPTRERVQRFRERQRKAEYYGSEAEAESPQGRNDPETQTPRECNAPVTIRSTDEDVDTDADVDVDADPVHASDHPSGNGQTPAAAAAPGPILERYGVIVSGPMQEQMWAGLFANAGRELFEAALRETVANANGPPSLRYVSAIIKRCQEEGTMPGQWREKGAAQPRASPEPPPTRWFNPLTDEEESVDDG